MNESEVRKLFLVIENSYNFAYDDFKVELWRDLLQDVPFETAQNNLRAYILLGDKSFPPHPGALAGRTEPDKRPYIPNAEETLRLIAEREQSKNLLPMPEGGLKIARHSRTT